MNDFRLGFFRQKPVADDFCERMRENEGEASENCCHDATGFQPERQIYKDERERDQNEGRENNDVANTLQNGGRNAT